MTSRALLLMGLAGIALGITACGSTPGRKPGGVGVQVAPLQPTPQDPLETIARFEDARTDGDGLLQALLQKGSPRTRERAAVALGRLDASAFGSSVTKGLTAALADESASVRAAAAFALGQRADKEAASALLAHWSDPDADVRARIVEAASRIDDGKLRSRVLASLDDPSAAVREMAALATSRFPAKAGDAVVVDTALVEFLQRDERSSKPVPDVEDRWRGLFALARRKSERARALFIERFTASDPRERMYAAQGLGAVGTDEASRRALTHLLGDADWRVACEAANGLGKQPYPAAFDALAAATQHPSAHVRRCAFEALGAFAESKSAARAVFERARVDSSPNVRAAAVAAGARLFGDEIAPKLSLAALEKEPLVRIGAAHGAAFLSTSSAVSMLTTLSADPDVRVAGAAIEGLAKHATTESRARLHALLRASDNGLRLAAVTSLGEMAASADLMPLRECLATSAGEIAAEIAAGIMDDAAKVGGDDALAILKSGLEHADPFVRKKARALIEDKYPQVELPRPNGKLGRLAAVPIPGKDAPLWTDNPRVAVETNRGTMLFELFPNETPAHVFNFLALVEKRHYDGLTFHRVVPNFVIQGGDHRGDGNGGITWRGEPLRAEFTPRAFVRGSLGMPRNDDPDSGGSQFFVTHRETPHLDGRYTIFGELRSGFEVLDAIEVGDRIVSITLLSKR